MEIEENINSKIKEEEVDSEAEEEEMLKKELLETTYLDLNEFDAKENDYLLVASYGNAAGFLKLSLYEEIKKNSLAFKGKFFQQKESEKNKPKKLVGELYQFKTESGGFSLVLFLKQEFNFQNYQTVADLLLNPSSKNNLVQVKKGVVFLESKFFKDLILSTSDNHELYKKRLFHYKNDIQCQSNQIVKGEELPIFNGIKSFSAYLSVKSSLLGLPFVFYYATYTEHEVCLENILVFKELEVSYSFLRGKLEHERLKNLKPSYQTILSEYNASKSNMFA